MSFFKDGRKRKIVIIASVIIAAAIAVACTVYLRDYYHADMDAVEAFAPANTVEMQTLEDDSIAFVPDDAVTGFIFYPGGKVEHEAYIPLMKSIASEGVLCVLVEMPFNLAVFDIDAAEGIQEQYPEIEHWYIGGHSLGGSMAASYLSDHEEEYDGLILLGSYSTADLTAFGLSVLSIYGSEDFVLNKENYEENKVNLPDDFVETVIEGGCHACFGMYGEQGGDGTPSITNEEQIKITAEAICEFVGQK